MNRFIQGLIWGVCIILIGLSLSSCAPFKKVFKSKSAQYEKVKVSTDVKKEASQTVTDKSKDGSYKETETITFIQGGDIKSSLNLAELIKGDMLTVESGLFKMTQAFDSASNQINTNVYFPERYEVKTEKEFNYRDFDIVSDVKVKTESKSDSLGQSKDKDKVIVKEPDKGAITGSIIGIALAIALILMIIIVIKKKVKH